MPVKSIVYITPALPVGGAEKFLVLLANSLKNDLKSQTVISLSSDNKLQQEFDPAVSFIAVPRNGRFDTAPIATVRDLLKKKKPDIIFCLNFYSFLYAKLALRSSGLKPQVVVSYHSTIHQNKKEGFLHRIYARLVRKSDLIITVSKNQKKYTAAKYHIPSRRFKTIHNGIDLSYWHLPTDQHYPTQIRDQYKIPKNARVIIMTAAFRPEKNHIGAIKSLEILHSKYQNKACLLFVGEGLLYDECRNLVKQMNLDDFVIFTGPKKDVRPYYWASDIFTLCSTSVETLSIAALEAMACGLPAVMTNIGGADEMIVENLNGFLCEPKESKIADAWHKALTTDFSPEKISRYIGNHFGADRMIEEYKEALQLA